MTTIPTLPVAGSNDWYGWAEALDTVARAEYVTGGSVRSANGAFHFFNDPAVVPTNPQPGDVWVGDVA